MTPARDSSYCAIAGLKLQRAESLAPGTPWEDVTIPPVEADGETRVWLDWDAAAAQAYFRLLKP